MKNKFTLILSLLSSFAMAQTTATNFTASDCSGASHTLFTELDAGKVIVICWVMPCGSCITPASTDATTVQGYASSNPGQVKFYLVDDKGNSTCSTVSNWANTNSITADAIFSNSGNVINMTSYGTSGMPKTVVLGGSSHTVYYNVNGAVTVSGLQSAINNALSATGMREDVDLLLNLNVFPNPVATSTSVSYTLASASEVKIELYNMVGANMKTIFSGKQNAADHEIDVDCSRLNSGIYFIKLSAGRAERTVMLSVLH